MRWQGRYPVEYESDVVLRDGSTLRVRPIRSDDRDELLAFYGRLSRESLHFRFFGIPGENEAEVARLLHDLDIFPELAGETVVVAVFGMGETATESGARLVEGLERAVSHLPGGEDLSEREFAPPPPWGPLEMTPREAFLGAQEVVPVEQAVGRIAAESLAAYPPGIPNVLPGERLTAILAGRVPG